MKLETIKISKIPAPKTEIGKTIISTKHELRADLAQRPLEDSLKTLGELSVENSRLFELRYLKDMSDEQIIKTSGFSVDDLKKGFIDLSWHLKSLDQKMSHVLTPRELQVYKLIKVGYRSKQIAGILEISISTVKSHVQSIFDRLNSRTRTAIVTNPKPIFDLDNEVRKVNEMSPGKILSGRDVKILELYDKGLTNKEIGVVFDVSEKTIKNRKNAVKAILGIERKKGISSQELLREARNQNLIPAETIEEQADNLDLKNPFSASEIKVLNILEQNHGISNQEIAERLGISIETVKNHLHMASEKIGSWKNRRQILQFFKKLKRAGLVN